MKVGKSKCFLFMLGVSVLATAAENDVNKSEKPAQPPMEMKKEMKIEPSNKTSEGYNLKFDVNENYTVKTAEISLCKKSCGYKLSDYKYLYPYRVF